MGAISYDEAVGGLTNSANATGQLTQSVNTLAPLATAWHGPTPTPAFADFTGPTNKGGVLSQFTHFIGGVASDIGHIGEGVGKWLVTNGVNAATSSVRYGQGLSHAFLDNIDINSIKSQGDQLTGELATLHQQFQSGRISQQQYTVGLKGLNKDMSQLVKDDTSLNNQINIHQKDAYKATIDTASLLLLFLGGEFGATTKITTAGLTPIAAKTTADYLASTSAHGFFQAVQDTIGSASRQKALFDLFTPEVKAAMERSVAEVTVTSATMTAGQIARASAVNMALKYPVYFNYLSETGHQVYKELDQAKYGDATRTLAFNALLLLSGGPIGYGLKYAGKATSRVVGGTFDKQGFWDAVSPFYGDGSKDGFAKAAAKIADNGRDPFTGKFWTTQGKKDFFQSLSDAAATNVKATGGDEVAAANRLAEAEKMRYNEDLTTIDHETALKEMYNFSKAQSFADEIARSNNLKPATVGRIDARSLKHIGDAVSSGATVEERLNNWEVAKGQNPGWAWAHSASLDRQVKRVIQDGKEGETLSQAITDIPASFGTKGFPEAAAKILAKQGYVPISPSHIEAPFVKGTGKFASRFLENDDVFTRSVQPIPVMSSIGTWLTKAGLSPNASQQRVYQMFNTNLADNLKNLDGTASIIERMGKDATDQQANADLLIKQLSSYAKNPTRGKIVAKMPITDLRMLTTSDIEAATGATHSEAVALQSAISRASMQMPLAVRGFGDRLVDASYNFSPTGAVMRRYLRIQGALRFSWNPFYQNLRVIPKTEYLTETKGGGVFNAMWQGRLKEVNSLREDLRTGGFFDQKGGLGSVISGEAVDIVTPTTRNLGKKLLPMQERSIAGLIDDQAQRMGMETKQYIQTFPEQVRDTVQAIAEYDKHSNFLNSPLARTMNVAFFPFRFETKVAMATAKGLSNTSLLTQVSVIHGLMQAHQWLNSPEGQAWYQTNADAIGIFKYISPLATFNEVFESLLPGHNHSLGNFGELGGLPFGWIPQLTDAEGLTQFQQPGVSPKTGEAIPRYIPVTLKGQAAIAVQDMVNSLFSYPGATIGLPSKTGIARNIALGLTGASKTKDLKLHSPQVSAQAQSYSEAISAQTAPPPAPGSQAPPVTPVPATPTPATVPRTPNAGSVSSKKKKKVDFVPALLPGQTSIGQL